MRYGRPGGRLRLTVQLAWRAACASASGTRARASRGHSAAGLFRKFSRLDTPATDQRRGTGLGLYNSWRIVQLHHGHIRADAQPGEWAEFTFEIPQPLCAADVADELETR